ncbi:hypothetical protein, conserved [Eimeria necatrix]|uniref:Uncharacterized protein n=1 Tax=Eimeria necatrix TaxID=51315 RepID=U6MKD3_9EIME|nr:hypothetical protein, conserved [Eimeria necatrix]CDJ64697.1 hypothetical protein, conserved [Eimeria necatrix]
MTSVFRRIPLPSTLKVYERTSTLRAGPKPSEGPLSLPQALAAAPMKVTFLHVDSLKGIPVDLELKESSPDPYFAQHLRTMYAAFFGSKKAPAS